MTEEANENIRPVVVVDTTATQQQPLLDTTHWTNLLTLASKGELLLYVPEVVLRETARHAQSQWANATKAVRQVQAGLKFFEALDLVLPTFGAYSADGVDRFRNLLRNKLESVGAQVAPLPGVGLDELVERDLAQTKPFDKNGKGFRDALIWASVKEVCGAAHQGAHVHFVTDNDSDFGASGQLAEDLELEVADWNLTRVPDLRKLFETSPIRELAEALEEEPQSERDASSKLGQQMEWDVSPEQPFERPLLLWALENALKRPVDSSTTEQSPDMLGIGEAGFSRQLVRGEVVDVFLDHDSLEVHQYETYLGLYPLTSVRVSATLMVVGWATLFPDDPTRGQGGMADWEFQHTETQSVIVEAQVRTGLGLSPTVEIERVLSRDQQAAET